MRCAKNEFSSIREKKIVVDSRKITINQFSPNKIHNNSIFHDAKRQNLTRKMIIGLWVIVLFFCSSSRRLCRTTLDLGNNFGLLELFRVFLLLLVCAVASHRYSKIYGLFEILISKTKNAARLLVR